MLLPCCWFDVGTVLGALGTFPLFRERKKSKPCLTDDWSRSRLAAGDAYPRNAEERGNLLLGAAPPALLVKSWRSFRR